MHPCHNVRLLTQSEVSEADHGCEGHRPHIVYVGYSISLAYDGWILVVVAATTEYMLLWAV